MMSMRPFFAVAAAALLASHSGCTWFDVKGMDPLAPPEAPEDAGSAGRGGTEGGLTAGNGGTSGGSAHSGGSGGSSGLRPPRDNDGGPHDGGCDAGCDAPYSPDADLTWHPLARRAAVTDESSAPDVQRRVWLLVRGGDTTPNRLVHYSLRAPEAGWHDTGLTEVTSGLAGVSYMLGETAYQSVFFTRGDRVEMLRERAQPSLVTSQVLERPEAPEGYTFPGGDLAAVTFEPAPGDRRIAVLAPAWLRGEPGFHCVFELELNADAWNVQCTEAVAVHPSTDVAGAAVGSEAQFFYRGEDLGLYRVARTPQGTYDVASLPAPDGNLAASLEALPSEIDGYIELFTVTDDGRLWNARAPASGELEVQWQELTPLGLGVMASTGIAALGAIVSENFAPLAPGEPSVEYRVTQLYAIGADGQLYYRVTNRWDPQRSWALDWYSVAPIGRDQYVRALGAVSYEPLPWASETFQIGEAMCVVGGTAATSLMEAQLLFDAVFYQDHVRKESVARLSEPAPIAELSATAGGDRVLVAAGVREAAPPFGIELFDSIDQATTFERVALEALGSAGPNELPRSVLHPAVGYGRGDLHLAALERPLRSDCREAPDLEQRIVYRRGDSAAALAGATLDDGALILRASESALSDPVLAVTDDGSRSTAYVAYREVERLFVAAISQGEVPAFVERELRGMPVGPPALATGARGELYVATAGSGGAGLEVCRVAPDGSISDAGCSATPIVELDGREIAFGPELPAREGTCGDAEPPHYACFEDERPYSIAADISPVIPRPDRVFVAYAGPDDDGRASAIYVTSSQGTDRGDLRDEWLEPIRISPVSAESRRYFFDAEIAIDTRRTVTITYSAIDAEPSPEQRVHVYASYAVAAADGTLTQLSTVELGSYDPQLLPYDCATGRRALGAYRQPVTVGARSLHALRLEHGYETRWWSEFVRP